MTRSAKVSISLPQRLLRTADRQRRLTGESRSEFFRRAAEALLAQQERAKAVQRYREGYLQAPESEAEVSWVAEVSSTALADEPWE
jgi:metal-responsive CopG/Arc/MetJ family transcriptional regulator